MIIQVFSGNDMKKIQKLSKINKKNYFTCEFYKFCSQHVSIMGRVNVFLLISVVPTADGRPGICPCFVLCRSVSKHVISINYHILINLIRNTTNQFPLTNINDAQFISLTLWKSFVLLSPRFSWIMQSWRKHSRIVSTPHIVAGLNGQKKIIMIMSKRRRHARRHASAHTSRK